MSSILAVCEVIGTDLQLQKADGCILYPSFQPKTEPVSRGGSGYTGPRLEMESHSLMVTLGHQNWVGNTPH